MPYWAPEDLDSIRRLHDQVLAGEAVGHGIECVFRHRDGSRFEALIYEAPLLDADGNRRGWMGSILDVTDRKRAERLARAHAENVQRTARLVTIGEMASLLAHNLNQPLAAILSYQAGLQNRLAAGAVDPQDLAPALTAIGTSAERAGRIIRQVQHFVKKSEPKLEPTSVVRVIEDAVALLEPELRKHHVQLELDLPPDLPFVRADAVLIEQVIVNLLQNANEALQAMPPETRSLTVKARRSDQGAIGVTVSDSGPGLPAALSGQLFSPFVSTKASGMGMGLAICRSIVELHGGSITSVGAEGNGAAFHFTLPVLI
jgi:two-component system sensor histidine kinase DctS